MTLNPISLARERAVGISFWARQGRKTPTANFSIFISLLFIFKNFKSSSFLVKKKNIAKVIQKIRIEKTIKRLNQYFLKGGRADEFGRESEHLS
jgi:hypothetical protein